MGEIAIRRANAGELLAIQPLMEQVDDLHRDALPWLLRKVGEPHHAEFLERFVSKPDRVALLAVTREGVPAGILLALVREAARNPIVRPAIVVEIDSLVVDRAFRRQGVGTALAKAAFQWAHDRGAARIELGVYEFNEGARSFWRSAGFEPLSRRLVRRGDTSD